MSMVLDIDALNFEKRCTRFELMPMVNWCINKKKKLWVIP